MPLPVWFRWMIAFMVNSFVRPTDLRNIQHQHMQIVRGRHTYLRLKLPESKKHTETIITLKPAVRVYEALLAHATKMGYAAPTDYLFYPEVINRKTAMMIMDVQFRRVLDAAGLRTGTRGQNRTLYSLRHTAITFRLLYGQGIDLLTLAKNARTSVNDRTVLCLRTQRRDECGHAAEPAAAGGVEASVVSQKAARNCSISLAASRMCLSRASSSLGILLCRFLNYRLAKVTRKIFWGS